MHKAFVVHRTNSLCVYVPVWRTWWCGGSERSTGDRRVLDSNPVAALRSGTLPIPFAQLCQCLSEDTLTAFYLVAMPGEVKYPTRGVNV